MSFMLGSFTGGMFGGAQSVMQLWNGYQDIQDRKAQIAAADKFKDTMGAQDEADKSTQAPTIDTTTYTPQPDVGGGNEAPASPIKTTPAKTDEGGGGKQVWDDQWDTSTGDKAQQKTGEALGPPPPPRDAWGGALATQPPPAVPGARDAWGGALSGPAPSIAPAPAPASPVSPPTAGPEPGTLQRQPVPPTPGGRPPVAPPQPAEAPATVATTQATPAPSVLSRPSAITNKPVGSTITAPTNPLPPIETTLTRNPPPPTPEPPSAGGAPVTGGRSVWGELFGIGSANAAEPTPTTPGSSTLSTPGAPGAKPAEAPWQNEPIPGSAVKPAPQPQGGALQRASAQANAANPPQVVAQQQTEKPAPGGGPTAVATPAQVAPVAPNQTSPTLQSEPTPPIIKARIPTNDLRSAPPDMQSSIIRVAQEEGVSPYRLASTLKQESNFNARSPNSVAGAEGMGQVMPGTRRQVDPGGALGNSPEDQMRLAARVINMNDRMFGQDSASSIMAYVAGPGNASKFATNFDQMAQQNPQSLAYVERMMGRKLTQADFTSGELPDPRMMVRAASQGPDQFINFIAQTGNPGMQMTDRWRQAETSMIYAAMRKGDYAGVAHARDLVFSMSHQGMFDNTMRAYQALSAGDGRSAAQFLARAHAFFPDGSMGRFGVDGKGNVWAQAVDEHDPSRALGGHFQVTPNSLMNVLAQTRDPKEYVKYLQTQQNHNETVRHNQVSEQLTHEGHMVTAENAAATRAETHEWHETQADMAAQRILSHQNDPVEKGLPALIEKHYGDAANPMAADGVTPLSASEKGVASQAFQDIYRAARGSMASPQAAALANGLVGHRYQMTPTSTGYYSVEDPAHPEITLGYISAPTARMIAGGSLPGDKKQNAPTTTTRQ